MGIVMILVGGLCFHIAASNSNPLDIKEVWKDLLTTFDGSNTGGGNVSA
jgi:hypothetical protein